MYLLDSNLKISSKFAITLMYLILFKWILADKSSLKLKKIVLKEK